MKLRNFKDLVAWQVAHSFTVAIYQATEHFPHKEQFGLTSQMRRAAVSVTSNIAEGYGRWTSADKRHFYIMAISSLNELDSQLLIAKDIGYLQKITYASLCVQKDHTARLLSGLTNSVISHPKYQILNTVYQIPKNALYAAHMTHVELG